MSGRSLAESPRLRRMRTPWLAAVLLLAACATAPENRCEIHVVELETFEEREGLFDATYTVGGKAGSRGGGGGTRRGRGASLPRMPFQPGLPRRTGPPSRGFSSLPGGRDPWSGGK